MTYTPAEMMTVAAARALDKRRRLLRRHRPALGRVQPGAADARAALKLIYESGTIETKPTYCRSRSAMANCARPR